MIVLLVQRMNAHSDDPRKGGTQSAQSSVAFGNIKKYDVLTKVSTRKHFSEYAYSRKWVHVLTKVNVRTYNNEYDAYKFRRLWQWSLYYIIFVSIENILKRDSALESYDVSSIIYNKEDCGHTV